MEVTISSYKGRLRLHLPRGLFDGKNVYLSLGLKDSIRNRKQAQSLATRIENDIVSGSFDSSLEKYRIIKKRIETITAYDLFKRFFEDKKQSLKATTRNKYKYFLMLFKKLGDIPLKEHLTVKETLRNLTSSEQRLREVLMYLSSASQWGIDNNLIDSNPYEKMYKSMRKPRYQEDPTPSPFTEDERDEIINNFYSQCPHYAKFVEFLFKTGCRPSEAVGLTWGQISPDSTMLTFDRSIVESGGELIFSEKSKNNRIRTIKLSKRVSDLIIEMRGDTVQSPSDLVFRSPEGCIIRYSNFCDRHWDKIVGKYTPYSCRDTFINIQLLKKASPAMIAAYCDTSIKTIEKYYLNRMRLAEVTPIE